MKTETTVSKTSSAVLSDEERRALRRAQITAQVLVRRFEAGKPIGEVGETTDASQDGLHFIGCHHGYANGQIVEVIFPYSESRSARSLAQLAEVVRVTEQAQGTVAVALHFCVAKATKRSEK